MKRRVLILRVAALASSAVLLGGYVWYRASAAPSGDATPSINPATPEKDAFFPGSKSAEVFPPESVAAPSTPEKPKDRAVMGGSKSAAVIRKSDIPDDSAKQSAPAGPASWKPPEAPPLLTPPGGPK